MKFCIWSTSFQADTLALAIALDKDPEVELLVVTKNKASYLSEPIAKFAPLSCPIIDRDLEDHEDAVRKFNPDVLFADNHLPKYYTGFKLVYHWHGLTLKIQSRKDKKSFFKQAQKLVGSIKKPNPKFLAHCYGEMDYDHRIKDWKIPAENCRIWGSEYSDLVQSPPYSRSDLKSYYGLDVENRKNILISFTWNYGDKAFGPLGNDEDIFNQIISTAKAHNANIIFSLHDKYRFHENILAQIDYFSGQYENTFVKFKNEHPDNLADLTVSDVMICNFSSFIVFHYFTGKPSIHIQPVDTSKFLLKLPKLKKNKPSFIWRRNSKTWLYSFKDNGGVMPTSSENLIELLNEALNSPNLGIGQAEKFISSKIEKPDGNSCYRMIQELKEWNSRKQ